MEEFGVRGSGCGRICYLRNIADADHLLACISAAKQEAEAKAGETCGDVTSGASKVADSSPDSCGRSVMMQSTEADAQLNARCGSADHRVSSESDSAHQSSPCAPRAVVIGGGYIGESNAGQNDKCSPGGHEVSTAQDLSAVLNSQ